MPKYKKLEGERKHLYATTDEEGIRSGYDTFVEKSDYQVTNTSLLLAGARSIYGTNGQVTRPGQPQMNGKPRHRRALSFAETLDPITLSWHNINVFAPVKGTGLCGRTYDTGEVKQLLHDVSGLVRPGTLLAVMGASGAGKSTLLNVLTYRNRGDLIVEGEVKVNGQPVERGIKALSAYIQQDDLFVGTLKVREHLWFQAQLRMDAHIPLKDRAQRIEDVMTEMGLMKCAETCIGVPGSVKGISGGEMKRLSFASEVLTNPPLMFCDEPTSGLDSFMAENVLRTLKSMVQKGKTILCTIHQPSSEAYQLFDQLLLLAEGRTAYMGDAKRALDFFQICGHPCPRNYNPADHFVHCLAIQPGQEYECRARSKEFTEKYKDTAEYRQLVLGIREIDEIRDTDLVSRTADIQRQSPYKASWCRQLHALVWRCWLAQARDANVFAVRIIQTVIISLLIGIIFFQQPLDEKGVMNINGALFLLLTNMTFSNFYTVLNSFPLELPIFFREHHNGMYRVDVYFIAKNIAELLIFLLLPTVFATIIYWLIGVQSGIIPFLVMWSVTVLVTKAAVSFGYFLSTTCGRIDLCLAFSPPMLLPLMLFGGYMLNITSLSVWIKWLQWLSWFRYGYEIIIVTQWKDVGNLTCTASAGPGLNGTSSPGGTPCFSDGSEIIKYYGFDISTATYALNFSMLFCIIIVLRFFSFLALWIRAKERHH